MFSLSACRPASDRPRASLDTATNRFEFNQPQMGLPFRIVLYAADRGSAQAAAAAAFARIAQLNDILSDYDTDSELSRLSRTAAQPEPVPVSRDLWIVLERSQHLAARTDGAFDITVGPLVNLWRKARRERKLPRADLLAQARTRVGWRHLQLDSQRQTARLLVPEMRLDLGAIAKGYATDEALKVLGRRGITRALISGGGDMTAGDPPPQRPGWRVEIGASDASNAPPARSVWLKNAGLATSGDIFQHLEIDGVRYSHIIDPHTGVGLTDHALVTVIAPDGITADSLSTAISVLGPEKGLRLIELTPNTDAQILRKPDKEIQVSASRGFNRHLVE